MRDGRTECYECAGYEPNRDCPECGGTGYRLCRWCRERPEHYQEDIDRHACDECTIAILAEQDRDAAVGSW